MTNETHNTEEIIKPSLMERFKKSPITYTLVGINLVVFILVHLTNLWGPDEWLLNKLSKITYQISVEKEYYRLLTAVFTHKEPMHLVFNCIALIILGRPVEYIFGRTKFLMIFLISGLFGSLGSFIFSPYAAIGASGGVFGIFGVHLYLFIKNRQTYLKIFGKDILQLLVINIVIGFIIPNIDYWGHFGGLFGGLLAATTFGLTRDASYKKSIIIGCIFASIIFSSLFMYFNHSYVSYSNLYEDLVEQANTAINNEDLMTLQTVRQTLEDKQPLFPPFMMDSVYDQMDYYIQKIQ